MRKEIRKKKRKNDIKLKMQDNNHIVVEWKMNMMREMKMKKGKKRNVDTR